MCIGIPGKIVASGTAQSQHAWAYVCGVRREVNIALVLSPEEKPDDLLGCWVLIHVGFAMSRLDEGEAHEMLSALRAMGDVEEDVKLFLKGEGSDEVR